MRADDDGAARLERNQDLVDGGRGRVRGRHDRRDDAERLGDLDDLPILDPPDDPDRLHRADEAVDLVGGEEVLLDLVGDDAVARFLVRQAGERLGLGRGGLGHGIDDGVDLFLGELGEETRGLLRAAREGARFVNRGQVAIGLGRGLRHAGPERAEGGLRLGVLDLGEDFLDFRVRAGDDVDRDELAYAPRRRRARVGRRLDRADITADEYGDVAGADVFLPDEHDVGGLHHGVGGLDGSDEAFGFDHS